MNRAEEIRNGLIAIGLTVPIGGVGAALWSNHRNAAIGVWVAAGLAGMFGIVLMLAPVFRWARRPRPKGLPGWASRVTEITPSPSLPGFWNICFRLFPPNGEPHPGQVICSLTYRANETQRAPRWHDASGDQPPHYIAFYSPTFDRAMPPRLDDGEYVVRWIGDHGIGWRDFTKPHKFRVRAGRVQKAKREQEGVPL